jgi:hypothetical protein
MGLLRTPIIANSIYVNFGSPPSPRSVFHFFLGQLERNYSFFKINPEKTELHFFPSLSEIISVALSTR